MRPISITVLFAALALLTCPCFSQEATTDSFRHWTTTNGVRSKGRLKVIDVTRDKVRLMREDNDKEIELKLSSLSKEDRNYLSDRKKRIRDAERALKEKEKESKAKEDEAAKSEATSRDESNSDPASNSAWSQWRGSNRDGKSADRGLLQQWPRNGPNLLWNVDGLGEGYSTPAVVGDKIYVLGTRGDTEYLIALSADNGQEIWHVEIGPKTGGGGFPGPKGTPTVADGLIYTIGGEGNLVCVSAANGKRVWQKNLVREFNGNVGHWRYAESPLVDNEKVICTPGGQRNTVVALNRRTGMPMWSSSLRPNQTGGSVDASYASPVAAKIGGQDQYVIFLHGGVVGIDANRGRFLWSYNRPANDTANCSTPVVHEDSVFAASAYGTGGGRVDVAKRGNRWSARESYFVRKMENHHGGFVLHDGYIYGTNNQTLLCIDWESGEIQWQDRCVGKGSTVFADGHLYVRGEKGDIALVEASPDGYNEKGRFSQPNRSDKNAWAYPVIANGRLYLHDQGRLLCYELK